REGGWRRAWGGGGWGRPPLPRPIGVFARPLIGFFRVGPAVVDETVRFLRVVLASVPAVGVVFVIAASLRAAGDTRTPLAVGAVVSGLNVALGFILIVGRLGIPARGVQRGWCG